MTRTKHREHTDPLLVDTLGPVAPRWGWRHRGSGRAWPTPARRFQSTTVQLAGLYPFVAGSGSPSNGVPIGRHMLWHEVVCLDPLQWLRDGLVTNTGIFLIGDPGVGKSALSKRLMRGMAAFGVKPMVLGDTKGEHTPVIEDLDGQVVRVGRGLDRINPLDSGPLGHVITQLPAAAREQLLLEVRGRRLSSLLALCLLVRGTRGRPISNGEEVVLGAAVDVLTRLDHADPTVPDVLRLIREPTAELIAASEEDEPAFRAASRELRQTLSLLLEGPMKGVFDGPTTRPLDLDAPAVSVDISRVAAAGDQLVAAAILSTWAVGYQAVDAAAALADHGLRPRQRFFMLQDEGWRALRGAAGLVDHADSLTRLARSKGIANMFVTHSLRDLEALPTEEDRAKAQGFVDRSAIVILAGSRMKELNRVSAITPLAEAEKNLVASWSATEGWQSGGVHPGRGKYLVKTSGRPGVPVQMTLTAQEEALYRTDPT